MNIIEQKFYDSKAFFNTQQTKDISFRKEQLKKLSKAIKSYESDILEALYTDLGKNKVEAYATEIGITLKSIKNARKELKNWTKTKNVDTPVNSGLKMLFYGGLKMSFFSGLRLSY
ncbi:hypothetical protein ACNF31_13180, partial [Staphylococcus aureus]